MMRAWALGLGCWLLAACGEQQPAEAEVAAELRALRAVLVQQGAPRTTPGFDATQLAAAMAPLREALASLAASQQDLQQRQLALTQELQRWSTLLVENVSAARREEAAAQGLRLQALEAAQLQQEARHREVEQMLQGALDRTADRLEVFLRRLGGDMDPVPGNSGPSSKPPEGATAPAGGGTRDAPAVPPASPPRKGSGEGADAPGATRSPASARIEPGSARAEAAAPRYGRRDLAGWWWSGTALFGIGVGLVCFHRWRRTASARHPVAGATEVRPADQPTHTEVAPDVQEIWAAAALLGEAVGRLRESGGAPPTSGLDQGAEARSLADFIVLDDELLQPRNELLAAPPRTPRDRPAPVASALPGPGPLATTCRLRCRESDRARHAVLEILAQEPGVLRRPEPLVRSEGDSLVVTFYVLPGLSPGERSHIEQRLRDAAA